MVQINDSEVRNPIMAGDFIVCHNGEYGLALEVSGELISIFDDFEGTQQIHWKNVKEYQIPELGLAERHYLVRVYLNAFDGKVSYIREYGLDPFSTKEAAWEYVLRHLPLFRGQSMKVETVHEIVPV